MKSVAEQNRPVVRLALSDWQLRTWELRREAESRTEDSFRRRQESKRLRNEADVRTIWNARRTKDAITERRNEVENWTETIRICFENVRTETDMLKEEKAETERALDSLDVPLAVCDECFRIRDSRLTAELTSDYVDAELKKELRFLEETKKTFADQLLAAAWEKQSALIGVAAELNLDAGNKATAAAIDNDQIDPPPDASFKYRLDDAVTRTHVVTYGTWTENNARLKLLAEFRISESVRLRDVLKTTRDKTTNDLRTLRDSTDFHLRKRIFETRSATNELQWQILRMDGEIKEMLEEIERVEKCFADKMNALKLAQTRFENRFSRPAIEKVVDDPDEHLKKEITRLEQTVGNVTRELNASRTACHRLQVHRKTTAADLDKKNHTLMTDVRCLDARIKLRTEQRSTERNLTLMKLDDEMAS